MSSVKLKAISQDIWLRYGGGPSRGGVCYYMCNFIESDKGIWNNPGTFANAHTAAQNFAQGSGMMAYAKAQNLRKAPQLPETDYATIHQKLEENHVYRVAVWVGLDPHSIGNTNHEVLVITGDGDKIIYFEPNFGFFEASNSNMNNREAFEYCVNQQYNPDCHAGNFKYFKVRPINSPIPKGFNLN